MPSNQKHNQTTSQVPQQLLSQHILFFPMVFFTLILWYGYRWLFSFPVWFDESLGKAFFFGLPVWIYVVASKAKVVVEPLRFSIMKEGLLLGIALGGMYGFITSFMSILQSGGVVQSAQLFQSSLFWYEFALAILTGFWETIFFFCFIAAVAFEKLRKIPFIWQVLLIVAVFVVFHLPNAFLRFSPELVLSQIVLLFFFSLGQTLVFYRWRNAYALILSHAIWGLVLLFHGS